MNRVAFSGAPRALCLRGSATGVKPQAHSFTRFIAGELIDSDQCL